MRRINLGQTPINAVRLTLCEGKAVVRNQNRINGLIGVRYDRIPPEYHGLLATATFRGTAANEYITWSTEAFEQEPTRLSDLAPDEQQTYRQVLSDAMQAYADACSDADPQVKRLLYDAITYAGESTVYCGEGRVVLTEWGMKPKNGTSVIGMPQGHYDGKKSHYGPVIGQVPQGEDSHDEPVVADEPVKAEMPMDPYPIEVPQPHPAPQPEPEMPKPQPAPAVPAAAPQAKKQDKSGKKRSIWWWLIPLIVMIAALGALLLFKMCSAPLIAPVPPDIRDEDIVLDSDSLRYVVGNRLMIVVLNQDKTLDEFAKDFYKKYDRKHYQLTSPDTLLNRVTLVLPAESRDEVEDALRLDKDFQEYNLLVMPDGLNKTNYKPSDPGFSEAKKRWYHDDTQVYDAWDVTKGDNDIIVAVIDDGFDLNHPEIKDKLYKPYNAVYKNSNVTLGSGHGTHVAGLAVAGIDNGDGVAGIAPNCRLMPIQAADNSGNFANSYVLDAVSYALANGADVINMSFGLATSPLVQFLPEFVQRNLIETTFKDEEVLWQHVFDICRQRNVPVVIAAGNDNVLIGFDPKSRSNYPIRVSATQPDHLKAEFSNYGKRSDVSAPGVQIYSSFPNRDYQYLDGTSMASPIVAGGVALLRSYDKNLTPYDIKNILISTATPSPSDVGPVVNFGRALSQAGNPGSTQPGDRPSNPGNRPSNPGARPSNPRDPKDPDNMTCEEINQRYEELERELAELKSKHGGCIVTPDTMVIPEGLTIDKLTGRWKSTTPLYDDDDQEIVLYFTFNGSNVGRLEIVEPNGDVYSAALDVKVSNDKVYIDQPNPATSPTSNNRYSPYTFVLKPDRHRKAIGEARNKMDSANLVNFNLVRI